MGGAQSRAKLRATYAAQSRAKLSAKRTAQQMQPAGGQQMPPPPPQQPPRQCAAYCGDQLGENPSENPSTQLSCGRHSMHVACLQAWQRSCNGIFMPASCPLCRVPVGQAPPQNERRAGRARYAEQAMAAMTAGPQEVAMSSLSTRVGEAVGVSTADQAAMVRVLRALPAALVMDLADDHQGQVVDVAAEVVDALGRLLADPDGVDPRVLQIATETLNNPRIVALFARNVLGAARAARAVRAAPVDRHVQALFLDAANDGRFEEAATLLDCGTGLDNRARCLRAVVHGLRDGGPDGRAPDAALQLVPRMVARIISQSPDDGNADEVHESLAAIGEDVAALIDPAAFAVLSYFDSEDVVSGAVRGLINLCTEGTADEREASTDRLHMWAESNVRGAARAVFDYVLPPGRPSDTHREVIVVASGLADMLYGSGYVEVTPTIVRFHNGNGESVPFMRYADRVAADPVEAWANRMEQVSHSALAAQRPNDWAQGVYLRTFPSAIRRGRRVITAGDMTDVFAAPQLIQPLVALRHDTTWLAGLIDAAAQAGNQAVVDALVRDPQRAPPSDRAVAHAVYNGHLEIAMLLLDRGYPPPSDGLWELAHRMDWRTADPRLLVPLLARIIPNAANDPGGMDDDNTDDESSHAEGSEDEITDEDVRRFERAAAPLEFIGARIALTINPAALGSAGLGGDDLGALAYGAVRHLIRYDHDAAPTMLPEWAAVDLAATARATRSEIAGDSLRMPEVVLTSGLADVLLDNGLVDVTTTSVTFRDFGGNTATVQRSRFPKLDQWAAGAV